jgi:hypothetical protein
MVTVFKKTTDCASILNAPLHVVHTTQ